jgi:CelD/BcsL family acetyltransferase involved in cellulose biosynthesis
MSETVEWITDGGRFDEIAADWDALAARERTPFLLTRWLDAWWAAFAPDDPRRRIAVLWRDGSLAGGLPLCGGRRNWRAPANDHTPAFGLLAADEAARERIVAEALAARALVLPALPEGDAAFQRLLAAARRAGRWTLVEPMNTSLVTETAGSFEDYRASLSSKVRSEVGRLRRKSEREHRLELSALEPPRELDEQMTRALELEASGWKGRKGTAILCAPETERFYRRVARDFHAGGSFRISELSLDGELAAMALSIVHSNRAFTLKVAYDERHRRLGPGFVLLMAMIERCFELGLDAYEFSGMDEEYERRFATGERPHRRLRIYRPGAANGARYVYHRRVRPLLKDVYHGLRRSETARDLLPQRAASR